jgi:uncharacterized membrane protein
MRMTTEVILDTVKVPQKRIVAIDAARGTALLAMASYHFTWDLEFFGYVPTGLAEFGGWKFYARCIASSFLFLVGVSLVLAHARNIRWNGFWKRLAMVVAAAMAITIATYFATPHAFIFFGILHQIALASLLGLAFLRLPAWVTLVAAALVITAPHFLRSPFFDHPALSWVGLSTINPRSNDYVPLFPWFGAVLAGIAITKLAASAGMLTWLADRPLRSPARPLALAGRHSLAFYLIHQPVLIACVWLFSQIWPAQVASPEAGFLNSCQASCLEMRDTNFCSRYCVCMLDALEGDGSLDKLSKGDQTADFRRHVGDLAAQCTANTDGSFGGATQ